MTLRLFIVCLLVAIARADPLAKHVVVIALDGCRPELIENHSTGALKSAWEAGAYAGKAQAVVPSVTQCNFASMLTSCQPAKHGIDRVMWDKQRDPQLRVRVPTVFTVLANSGRSAVAFLGHEKLYSVEAELPGIHFEHSPSAARDAAPQAAAYLRQHQPAFAFIYFGDLDGAGHQFGWLSNEQKAVMAGINRGVELVFAAIRETAMRDHTIVIITSDHGGHGKAHSQATLEDTTIPWICWGANVRKGARLDAPVSNMDTAATALFALGMAAPAEWDGRAVTTAFNGIVTPSAVR